MAAVSPFESLCSVRSVPSVDKLTSEIFSILENKFLFGCESNDSKLLGSNIESPPNLTQFRGPKSAGKVRVLCIDGAGATDGILAAKSLVHLEAALRRKSGDRGARIADYFDAVAGSGTGGILAAMLFSRGSDGGPLFTAEEALNLLLKNRRKISRHPKSGILGRVFRSANAAKLFHEMFGERTLKDTLKSVLIPCYDLATGGPFLFSRADALEMDGYDFKMKDVCLATSADPSTGGATEIFSVDRRTKISAVDGAVAMNNPTAAAITHVLNNKQEFPFCKGVEDLVVVSLGNGESGFAGRSPSPHPSTPTRFARIAGESASDMVDQAVSMAFGGWGMTNYIRVQGNEKAGGNGGKSKTRDLVEVAEEMLRQRSVEAMLFQGKKVGEKTNMEKIESVAGDVVEEQVRRKTSILPTVVLKQPLFQSSPRTSSATSFSTISST